MKLVARRHAALAGPDARGVRERDRRDRRRRAARRTACCTCSRSPPRPGSSCRSTTSTRSPARTPIVADLKPGGRYVATDLFEAGGVGARRARARAAPASSHEDARGVDGRTLGEVADGAFERPGQDVVVSWDDAAEADRRPRDPARQRSRRTAASSSSPATSALHHSGPARVFDSEEACFAAVKARAIAAGRRRRDPLRGPGRRPGHARDAARHRVARRRGARRRGRADHRRPLLGRDARPDGRPHRARGVPRRPDRARPRRRHDRASTSRARRLDLDVPDDELARRAAEWQQPEPRYTRGVFAKYAATRRLRLRRERRPGELSCSQQPLDRARRLADPLLVLDEREAHVPVAARRRSRCRG